MGDIASWGRDQEMYFRRYDENTQIRIKEDHVAEVEQYLKELGLRDEFDFMSISWYENQEGIPFRFKDMETAMAVKLRFT
jgi:hypothetical protein